MNRPVNDDAQREMEQRALRNVRGLVDKMEEIEKVDRGVQRRLFGMIILITLVVGGIVLAAVIYISRNPGVGKTLVIDPPKPTQQPAAPPRK